MSFDHGAEILRFTTAGSVDDGKSTLIGRLLLDSKAIMEDQLASVERASRQRGDPYVDLALITDGLRAEREQGITIDVAYRYFATPRRKFIIADTPGHVQYTRNMVTGASTADLAIILIDARNGVVTQSRRHGFLASLLQVPHVVVAVNKMDVVGYREEAFQSIVDSYEAFASRLKTQDVTYVPISALLGDNVVRKSDEMPWYDGPSLMHCLEQVSVSSGRNLVDFRFPVQVALRPNQGPRAFAGQVASGSVSLGEDIVALPSGRASRLRAIVARDREVDEAIAGDSIALMLEDEIDISRGDMIVRRRNLPQAASQIDCILCWLGDEPLVAEAPYVLQHTTRQLRAFVSEPHYRINMDTLHREGATSLQLNDIGRVTVTTTQPLFFDPYQVNRATGAFILIDPSTNHTVAAGMIRGRAQNLADVVGRQASRSPTNVVADASAVSREVRERRNGHLAAVLWLTGLSGSGKSTLARLLDRRLHEEGHQTFCLDGDALRQGLNADLGFSAGDRKENIRRAAQVARLAFDHGFIVICTFISPYQADRDAARALLPKGRFFEVYVKCDPEVCRQRDPKGLYGRAVRGEIREFTGVSAPYEAPEQAELVVDTDMTEADESVGLVLERLRESGVIRG